MPVAVSTLYLVRHGQASFGADDYDALSPLGSEQVRRLGAAWGAARLSLDALYAGPRRRQRDSAAELCAAAAADGHLLPEPRVAEGFDEIDHGALFREARRVASRDGGLPRFAAEIASLIRRWAEGDHAVDGLEPFSSFAARVTSALAAIEPDERRGRRAAVVTSSGPIACCLRHVLGLDPERTVDLMLTTANASVTALVRREGRWCLGGYNDLGHLGGEARLVTRI
jgi:broad specificity phosphatase PhoE